MRGDMAVAVAGGGGGLSYSLATDLFDLLILAGCVGHVRGTAARFIRNDSLVFFYKSGGFSLRRDLQLLQSVFKVNECGLRATSLMP